MFSQASLRDLVIASLGSLVKFIIIYFYVLVLWFSCIAFSVVEILSSDTCIFSFLSMLVFMYMSRIEIKFFYFSIWYFFYSVDIFPLVSAELSRS